jgi:adenylosuccinate lyase
MLQALSPLDGRYSATVGELREYFSEGALIRARIEVEIRYFIALANEPGIRELPALRKKEELFLLQLIEKFREKDALGVKAIEAVTKHDVKAVEYYLKRKMEKQRRLRPYLEFVHFGLTSEDVNNLAYGILIHRALSHTLLPSLRSLHADLQRLAKKTQKQRMLSLTHGQPATPTTVGKEMMVFAARLERQLSQLRAFRMQGKLGGAVGNFSAHRIAYPDVDWEAFRRTFLRSLKLSPLAYTTQINPHDDIAELSHLFHRIDTILLDCSRDMWLYISRGIFRQKVAAGEVGSSTMPHKVNPIDFENAEGNLGLANALFDHFAGKLPVSRLQRDLSDSTVQRSIGVAFGYHFLAVASLRKGLSKIMLDRSAVRRELLDHPEVVAEGIQTMLRKHGVSGAYEKLKKLTRGEKMTKEALLSFIDSLALPKKEMERLRGLL